eukprot:188683-Prymnesium_polylepis.1
MLSDGVHIAGFEPCVDAPWMVPDFVDPNLARLSALLRLRCSLAGPPPPPLTATRPVPCPVGDDGATPLAELVVVRLARLG